MSSARRKAAVLGAAVFVSSAVLTGTAAAQSVGDGPTSEVKIDPTVKVEDGYATVKGTATCPAGAGPAQLVLNVTQDNEPVPTVARGYVDVPCDGTPHAWTSSKLQPPAKSGEYQPSGTGSVSAELEGEGITQPVTLIEDPLPMALNGWVQKATFTA